MSPTLQKQEVATHKQKNRNNWMLNSQGEWKVVVLKCQYSEGKGVGTQPRSNKVTSKQVLGHSP